VRFPAPDRHRESFDSKKLADAALTKARGDRNEGVYIAPKSVPTFKEVADGWLMGKAGCKPSTLDAWRVHIEIHLVPLHKLRVNQIGIGNVETLRDALLTEVTEKDATEEKPERKKLSAQTANKVLTTAAAILERAVRHNWCVKNPAASVERARIVPNQVLECEAQSRDANHPVRADEVLNLDEIRRLLGAADPSYRTLFMAAALTGMRSGELLGLRWSDVELQEKRIYIRRSLSWARVRDAENKPPELAQPRFFEPKTATSRRTIPIAPELVAALKRWKLECPKGKDDLVFPAPSGAPAHRSNVLRRGLYPALSRAKLRRVDMHSLRHSFASILIAAGTPITEVQALLGHSSAQTTLKVYSHWFKSLKTGSIDALAKVLLGTGGHLVDTSGDEPKDIAVNDGENFSDTEENLVPPAGFEPTAPGLGILCSIHLS
jgi:integrase